jgi:SAM-dependent methyltransferase
MTEDSRTAKPHSADEFVGTRDHWWRAEQLDAVAKHLRLETVRSLLDVGCGLGHWTRALANVLPDHVTFTGVDAEPSWIEQATKLMSTVAPHRQAKFQVGAAESLAFPDASFDLVTCQTLLMHVRDPAAVVRDMVRVTAPGGWVLVAEATNVAGPLVESIALGDAPEQTAELLRFQLICERGKRALGEGSNLIGESLPALLHEAGLHQIELRQNDRAWPLVPPYDDPVQKMQSDEIQASAALGSWIWDEATTRRYYRAGGGPSEEFPARWNDAIEQRRRLASALAARTFSCAGGSLFYMAWGRRR